MWQLLGLLALLVAPFYWFYHVIFGKKEPVYSKPISKDKPEGETAPYRATTAKRGLVTKFSNPKWADVHTVSGLMERAAEVHAERKMLGWRSVIKMHKEVREFKKQDGDEVKVIKKDWYFPEKGSYQWMTYAETFAKIKKLSNGLRELGLQSNSRLGLYCETRPEWNMMAHACFRNNITVVTVYPNLGEDGLIHALEQGKLEFIFTSADLLGMLAKLAPELSTLKGVIYVDEPKPQDLEAIGKTRLRAVTIAELEELGRNEHKPTPPKSDDLAVIMYTSGTTGAPKGVMLSHANMIACAAATSVTIDLKASDIYIAFLPLAHVLELIVETTLLHFGSCLGYANARTLTDETVKHCKGDIRELRPTLMAGVPLVWERIRKGAIGKIDASSAIQRKIFWGAYSLRGKSKVLDAILQAIVFKKFAAQVGGRLRLMISGGAALSRETQTFIKKCFGAPFLQGYGLTETCGASFALPWFHPGIGIAGAPLPCIEFKLKDVPEMNYLSSDSPPKGEICLRGPSISQGYYEMPEQTQADFGADGWFSTGDVGEIHPDGTLAIIDRKKNLVKLSHGEYIALEKLETKYKDSMFVNMLAVYGASDRDFPVALVLPHEKNVTDWARSQNISFHSLEDLCENPKVVSKVLASMDEAARKNQFKSIEVVKGIALIHEEWTPENGMLTAAMKLRRGPLYEKHKDLIERAYKSASS